MIRKAIILVLVLAGISTGVLWFALVDGPSFSKFADMHFMGFALTPDGLDQPLNLVCYRSSPSVAITIWWRANPQYDVLIVPLWFLFVAFWCYPVKVVLHRAKKRRYVERRWFAVTAGMVAFAIAAFATMNGLFDSVVYGPVAILSEKLTGSETAAMALALVLLTVLPAIAALVTHNVIAGPLRRTSLGKPRVCVNCSYDLTGNVSGICPECGKPLNRG